MVRERLARELRQRDVLLERWMECLLRRCWALGRASAPADGGPAPLEVVREHAETFLEGLALALQADTEAGGTALEVGSPAFREPIQTLSFTAGWLAGRGLPAGDALALVHALDEALSLPLRPFFEALALVVSEAYCAALRQREQARYREAMEKVQLVCTLHPRLPCLFLVGDPDLQALDDALGRLLMLAVMREAPAIIIDGSGLFRPAPVLASVVERLADEKRVTARAILCGFASEPQQPPHRRQGGALSQHPELAQAVAEAAALLGVSWPTGLA